ncbi:hypothetical protein PR048_007972 [Dryococelus australis]|uniref:Uncharacterized protein n=1 Tax=Dryococelus australis TaxID=614101 RepID=A0ABQ9HVS7_9NEOP|nr:hypothetical protein PR048_007972 [Dryococelus australis]
MPKNPAKYGLKILTITDAKGALTMDTYVMTEMSSVREKLQKEEAGQFRNFIGITPATFEELVRYVSPLIYKHDTIMGSAI